MGRSYILFSLREKCTFLLRNRYSFCILGPSLPVTTPPHPNLMNNCHTLPFMYRKFFLSDHLRRFSYRTSHRMTPFCKVTSTSHYEHRMATVHRVIKREAVPVLLNRLIEKGNMSTGTGSFLILS